MPLDQSPQIPASLLSQLSGLSGVFTNQLNDVIKGRPMALDYLYRTLDALGRAEQMGQQRYGFEQTAPYMADPYKQAREQWGMQKPYFTDPYEFARQSNARAQQAWNIELPYRQAYYGQAQQDLMSPYRPGLFPGVGGNY